MTPPTSKSPAVLEFKVFPQMNNYKKRQVVKLTSLQMEREGSWWWGASKDFFAHLFSHKAENNTETDFYEEQLFHGQRSQILLVSDGCLGTQEISECKQLRIFGQQVVPEYLFCWVL